MLPFPTNTANPMPPYYLWVLVAIACLWCILIVLISMRMFGPKEIEFEVAQDIKWYLSTTLVINLIVYLTLFITSTTLNVKYFLRMSILGALGLIAFAEILLLAIHLVRTMILKKPRLNKLLLRTYVLFQLSSNCVLFHFLFKSMTLESESFFLYLTTGLCFIGIGLSMEQLGMLTYPEKELDYDKFFVVSMGSLGIASVIMLIIFCTIPPNPLDMYYYFLYTILLLDSIIEIISTRKK